jgi:hypothetical protein
VAPVTVTPVTAGLPAGAVPPFFDVVYQSPSQGELEFSWTGPLVVAGAEMPIADYPRMENPWASIEFGDRNAVFYDRQTSTGLAHQIDDQPESPVRSTFRTH